MTRVFGPRSYVTAKTKITDLSDPWSSSLPQVRKKREDVGPTGASLVWTMGAEVYGVPVKGGHERRDCKDGVIPEDATTPGPFVS